MESSDFQRHSVIQYIAIHETEVPAARHVDY